MKERTNFKFNVERVLQILSDDIYDSPLSLLRENVQNAYDAILQRKYYDAAFGNNGAIRIYLNGNELTISDNGIGMTKEMLDNWVVRLSDAIAPHNPQSASI